jgi:hypothetical protein
VAANTPSTEGWGGGFRVAGGHQPSGEEDVMNQPAHQHGEETYRGSARLGGKAAVITGPDSGVGRAEV